MQTITKLPIAQNSNFLKELSTALKHITEIDKFVNVLTKIILDTANLISGRIHIFPPGTERTILREKIKMLESQLYIPLIANNSLVGVFVVDNNNEGAPFAPEKLRIISELADMAAAGILAGLNIQRQIGKNSIQDYFLSNMNSGIISISPEKTIVSFNKQAENILGMDAQQLYGKSVQALPAEIREKLLLALLKENTLDKEHLYLFSHNIPISVSSFQIKSDNNQVLGAAILFTDLSSRYHAGYFKSMVRDEIRRSKRYGHCFSVLFIHIQDIGKESGLKFTLTIIDKFRNYLRSLIRETDKYSRYSVNEIALLLPETNVEGASILVKRIITLFSRILDKEKLKMAAISIGIAEYPSDSTESEELIQSAVKNFYQTMSRDKASNPQQNMSI